MHHLLIGRVSEVTRNTYTNKEDEEVTETVVTVSAGSESCQTTGEDSDYHYDDKVCLKVKARAFPIKGGGAFIKYQRLERFNPGDLASDIALFGGVS